MLAIDDLDGLMPFIMDFFGFEYSNSGVIASLAIKFAIDNGVYKDNVYPMSSRLGSHLKQLQEDMLIYFILSPLTRFKCKGFRKLLLGKCVRNCLERFGNVCLFPFSYIAFSKAFNQLMQLPGLASMPICQKQQPETQDLVLICNVAFESLQDGFLLGRFEPNSPGVLLLELFLKYMLSLPTCVSWKYLDKANFDKVVVNGFFNYDALVTASACSIHIPCVDICVSNFLESLNPLTAYEADVYSTFKGELHANKYVISEFMAFSVFGPSMDHVDFHHWIASPICQDIQKLLSSESDRLTQSKYLLHATFAFLARFDVRVFKLPNLVNELNLFHLLYYCEMERDAFDGLKHMQLGTKLSSFLEIPLDNRETANAFMADMSRMLVLLSIPLSQLSIHLLTQNANQLDTFRMMKILEISSTYSNFSPQDLVFNIISPFYMS